ncbi:DNA repair protein rad18 [Poronia punctata]|nr:DNA repair protein rad18 [Poronia punctata]
MHNDSFDNVADSTDWLSTPLSGLSAVEAALRCQICKDFYKTPMLTSCNHTFCSLCIRRALSNDGKCPLCRASEQEIKLRSNWSMEEVVDTFREARPAILEYAQKPPPTRLATPKRKFEEDEEEEEEEQGGKEDNRTPSSKRLRTSARLSKTRAIEATATMARQEAHIPDPEPEPALFEPEPNDGLVACPICWRRMKEQLVDRHIETSCPGVPNTNSTSTSTSTSTPKSNSNARASKPTITSAFAPTASPSKKFGSTKPQQPLDRLPALNYSMFRDAHLRKVLSDLGLPTTGSRPLLERRHREWTMLWNANCDSQRPKRTAELLQDLDAWERTFGARAGGAAAAFPSSSRGTVGSGSGAQIRDKDFDGEAWSTKHDASFRDLIASARRTRSQAHRSEEEKEEEPGKQASEKGEDGVLGDEPEPDVQGISMVGASELQPEKMFVDRGRASTPLTIEDDSVPI